MGILIDMKTVQREKRYMGLNIVKSRTGVNTGTITIATGYYDIFVDGITEWVTEREETITLSNDQLSILFNVKASQLGLTAAQANLFAMLDKSIYAVISGQIPIHADFTITAKKGTTLLSDYSVSITKPAGHVFNSYAMNTEPLVINIETVLEATVTIQKYGYKTYTKSYPALTGKVNLDVVLEIDPDIQDPVVEQPPLDPPAPVD